MKRHQTLVAMFIAVCLCAGLTSCEKDGVYHPKKKISAIYSGEDGEKHLSQRWSWDGNKLDKIEYYYDGDYEGAYIFSYDGKRLKRAEAIGENHSYEYTYDGKKLSKITSYDGGRIEEEYTFSYDKNTIHMTYTSYNNDIKSKGVFSPLCTLFPQEVCQKVTASQAMAQTNATKGNTSTAEYTFNIEKGNVASYTYTSTYKFEEYGYSYSSKSEYTCTFEYDNCNNPYQGFLLEGVDSEFYSKNNVTRTALSFKSKISL